MEQLGIRDCHWVGASMGGALGIRLAAGALKRRIKRLVVNDMGPKIADAAVERIKAYAGKPPQLDRVSELEQYFRTIYEPYGWLSDEQWAAWDAIEAPTLCLRGETSDLLLPEVAAEMRHRGPKATVITIAGCGHAPPLNVPDQLSLVERFLSGR